MTIVIATVVSFIITAFLYPVIMPILKRLKFGQSIKDIGPSWHKKKEGTPTMGGILFIIAIIVTYMIISAIVLKKTDLRALSILICAIGFGLIGLVDDYIKVALKRNQGLNSIQKIILQTLICIGFLVFLKTNHFLSTAIVIPFTKISIEFGIFYYVIALLVMLYMVNAVNLTDGVDGLASSVMIPVLTMFLLVCINLGTVNSGVAILCGAAIGGCLGFLIYNLYPASIFMGDTGSLFLGGFVVALAISLNQPIVVLISGFVFAFEALSVVIQVVYFKFTKKRIFKMSPIHHHFEMCKWSETKIVYIFTAVSIVCSLIGYLSIK